jgi:hypothetical protein
MAARAIFVEGNLAGLCTGGKLRNLHLQVGTVIRGFAAATAATRNKYPYNYKGADAGDAKWPNPHRFQTSRSGRSAHILRASAARFSLPFPPNDSHPLFPLLPDYPDKAETACS